MGDFFYPDLLSWPQRWCQQLGHWAVTADIALLVLAAHRHSGCSALLAWHRAPHPSAPSAPSTTLHPKAAEILLLISREALLWNYSWKKRVLQPGCLFWGMCCHGSLGRRETSPVLERVWHCERATCPQSLAPAPQSQCIHNGVLHCPSYGDNRVSNTSTPAVKFLKFLTFTPAKQVDIPLLNGRLIGAQIHLHEFSVFNRWH